MELIAHVDDIVIKLMDYRNRTKRHAEELKRNPPRVVSPVRLPVLTLRKANERYGYAPVRADAFDHVSNIASTLYLDVEETRSSLSLHRPPHSRQSSHSHPDSQQRQDPRASMPRPPSR